MNETRCDLLRVRALLLVLAAIGAPASCDDERSDGASGGGGGAATDAGSAGSAGMSGSAGVTSCPPPPAALPSGALTRWSGNPLLRNGPELYDFAKTGPRAVIRMGASDYRMWYEAVSQGWMTGVGVTAIGYATSS